MFPVASINLLEKLGIREMWCCMAGATCGRPKQLLACPNMWQEGLIMQRVLPNSYQSQDVEAREGPAARKKLDPGSALSPQL